MFKNNIPISQIHDYSGNFYIMIFGLSVIYVIITSLLICTPAILRFLLNLGASGQGNEEEADRFKINNRIQTIFIYAFISIIAVLIFNDIRHYDIYVSKDSVYRAVLAISALLLALIATIKKIRQNILTLRWLSFAAVGGAYSLVYFIIVIMLLIEFGQDLNFDKCPDSDPKSIKCWLWSLKSIKYISEFVFLLIIPSLSFMFFSKIGKTRNGNLLIAVAMCAILFFVGFYPKGSDIIGTVLREYNVGGGHPVTVTINDQLSDLEKPCFALKKEGDITILGGYLVMMGADNAYIRAGGDPKNCKYEIAIINKRNIISLWMNK
jgi:hypothetical protein